MPYAVLNVKISDQRCTPQCICSSDFLIQRMCCWRKLSCASCFLIFLTWIFSIEAAQGFSVMKANSRFAFPQVRTKIT